MGSLVCRHLHLPSDRAQRDRIGVKSYPRGVTTNSDSGIESYEVYYPVFEAMEQEGIVLNLHGELPSNADTVRHRCYVFQG
jgi:dihydroorotase